MSCDNIHVETSINCHKIRKFYLSAKTLRTSTTTNRSFWVGGWPFFQFPFTLRFQKKKEILQYLFHFKFAVAIKKLGKPFRSFVVYYDQTNSMIISNKERWYCRMINATVSKYGKIGIDYYELMVMMMMKPVRVCASYGPKPNHN